MNCGELFFPGDNSLHERIKLSSVVSEKGIAKKNELIEFLRVELKEAFQCDVKFWLQGSYKSSTLIKPVDKYSTYDIDVGIYLFFDAEEEGISSKDVKDTLKDALQSYCAINNEATIQESKNACEGLKFPSFLTIDTPIYFKTDDKIKLATDKEWTESDPKSIQDWLTNAYYDKKDRALMKRVVRYVKAWVNIQWSGKSYKKIPSLAINVLVAQNLSIQAREDDTFIHTVINICNELENEFEVLNPLNGSNILVMPYDSHAFALEKLSHLKATCLDCLEYEENEKAINLSNLFEHYFPQITVTHDSTSVGLPALTTSPEISICRYDKNGTHIETYLSNKINNIIVNKGDSLTFTICNSLSYNALSQAQWTVRNVGDQANDANDIGHSVSGKVNESHKRETAYTGSHTMECIITHNRQVVGFEVINVTVKPARTVKRVVKRFWRF